MRLTGARLSDTRALARAREPALYPGVSGERARRAGAARAAPSRRGAARQVYPEKGTVSFSAGLHGWAFTLTVFANLYAKKFGVEARALQENSCEDAYMNLAAQRLPQTPSGQQRLAWLASGRVLRLMHASQVRAGGW